MKKKYIPTLLLALAANICIGQVNLNLPDSIKILYEGDHDLIIARNLNIKKCGILNSDGSIHTPFIYDGIKPFHNELALAYKNSKCGYLNLKGEIQIPFDYVIGDHFSNGKATVSKNFVNGVINTQNEVVIDFKYNTLITHDHTTYHFQLEPKKSGLMDANENILVEPEFDIFMRENDSLWIGRRNWKFEIYNNHGELHNEMKFDELARSANSAGLIWCSVDGLYGFLDEHYNLKINPQYKKRGPAVGNLQSVSDGEKFGFIDKDNNKHIDYIYDKVQKLNDKACIVVKDGKSNLLGADGNLIFETEPKYITPISQSNLVLIDGKLHNADLEKVFDDKVKVEGRMEKGRLKVFKENKLGYVDTSGQLKIPFIYDAGERFYKENTTAVSKDGKWGFIDSDNKPLTEIVYDSVIHYGSIYNCNFLVKQGNLFGVFQGDKILYQPTFDEVIPYGYDNLIFKKGDSYSVIDKQTNKLKELPYQILEADDLGYLVKQNEKYGFLNPNFEVAVPLEYDTLMHLGFFLIASKDEKYGTLSDTNKTIEAFRFDEIVFGTRGAIKARIGNKFGLLGESGKLVLDVKYDAIKKADWKNVEVTSGNKTEIINFINLELELIGGDKE